MIYEASKKYLGTPFKFKGRTKNGFDCAGHLILALKDTGYLNEDYTFDEYKNMNPKYLKRELIKLFGDPIDKIYNDSILLMKLDGLPTHLAVYKDGNIIHTYFEARKLIEEKFSTYWKNKVESIYTLRGID